MTTPRSTPYKSSALWLALAATALIFGSASLLLAHEAPSQAQYQQIEASDITLVMSEADQLQQARRTVHRELIRPLRPQVEVETFSRAMPRYNPDFRPVFAQAQNGTVPFAVYKHTYDGKRKGSHQNSLHLVGFYDVTRGEVMVFDSLARTFVAAKGLGENLQKIGSHQAPAGSNDRPTELAKHHPLPQEITQ